MLHGILMEVADEDPIEVMAQEGSQLLIIVVDPEFITSLVVRNICYCYISMYFPCTQYMIISVWRDWG
jgi:hypothetical protein